jgi:LysR family transcriptional regulator, hydrogen peroxide-inducible genes activator
MTLTDLRYIVALARERHFGHAAERCFVSQPTLSVAIKKLEDELGVAIFERGGGEVQVTPIGEQIVAQAKRVLAEAARIKELAATGKDHLTGPLRLGAIYTVGPYLLPRLVPLLSQSAPQMPLVLQENFTDRLLEALRHGEMDVIIIALPHEEAGLVSLPVYDEPFRAVAPTGHPWKQHSAIQPAWLLDEPLLMLSAGNCFRDQVLDLCAHAAEGRGKHAPRLLEGSSLETLRQMVSGGMGVTVMPSSAADPLAGNDPSLLVLPFVTPEPVRHIGLVWRSSFPRTKVIDVLRDAMLACGLPGATSIAPR